MIYAFIALTIIVYFLIVVRIFYGINDEKTVSFISKIKHIFKTKDYKTMNPNIK